MELKFRLLARNRLRELNNQHCYESLKVFQRWSAVENTLHEILNANCFESEIPTRSSKWVAISECILAVWASFSV